MKAIPLTISGKRTPKIDVQYKNVNGKEDTIATFQVDILVPKRMGIVYINEMGKGEYPVIIHRAILGAYERFIGFLLEKTGGEFPFWIAPEQVRILTLNDGLVQYAKSIKDILDNISLSSPIEGNRVRSSIDHRNESVQKKIKE